MTQSVIARIARVENYLHCPRISFHESLVTFVVVVDQNFETVIQVGFISE